MSALKSVALAIDVATRRRDEAGQALQQAHRAVQFAQNQLDQLQGYADDTQARWATASAVAFSGQLMQHHQQFMARLQHAIGLQGGVIADLRRQAEAARLRNLEAEVRLAGLQQVMKKKLAERAGQLARREQKQMDEFAMLQHARRSRALESGERS